MALFSRNKKAKTTASTSVSKPVVRDLAQVLRNPRITEKAADATARRVYVFDVACGASKTEIVAAIRAVYKVVPAKVRTAPVPTKDVRNARTGVRGTTARAKKAYVYLKEGETITLT